MDNGRTLRGSFRIDFEADFDVVGVPPVVHAFTADAGESIHFLCSTCRLDVFGKNLVRRWCVGSLPDDLDFVCVFGRSAVLNG